MKKFDWLMKKNWQKVGTMKFLKVDDKPLTITLWKNVRTNEVREVVQTGIL